jgi:hypothetical protein
MIKLLEIKNGTARTTTQSGEVVPGVGSPMLYSKK